jgi:DNA-binding MarR family transcriptional regulator
VTAKRDPEDGLRAEPLPLSEALLFQLALRGVARVQDLAAAAGVSDEEALATIAVLEDEGLVQRRSRVADERVAATAPGRERAARVIAAERGALATAVRAVDAEFAALNGRVKQILLRWQVRTDRPTQVPNDHADARYDRAVLAELRDVHGAADALLAHLEPLRARYASLRRRLRDALARALAGDVRAIAGVTGDSFHTAWWELHGDLLAVLGRVRGEGDV